MIKFLAVAGLLTLAKSHPAPSQDTNEIGVCGYKSCTKAKSGMINVHLVPHTHDDVGWLKTVDQYYYGSKTYIQNAGVQYIIDSVVNELQQDPEKKFIYVETAYFWKWWKEQNDDTKSAVKRLVHRGQLEFIGGGWTMNDEATTLYQSAIDQFTWGFRKLNDTFGSCGRPKIGWQIDPFGHSKEMASLMAQFGFDGLFFGRLDYQDKMERLAKKEMEMIWEGDQALGATADLFTSALYNHYSAPPGFCFDVFCNDDPFVTDPNSPDNKVQEKVSTFIDWVQLQKSKFLTNNIILTMGEDFHYIDAHQNYKNLDLLIRDDPVIDNVDSTEYNIIRKVDKFLEYVAEQNAHHATKHIMLTMGDDRSYQIAKHYFKNLDKLIRYVNERQSNGSNVNVFYSTPSCYVKSLYDTDLAWPVKKDDFFPYASDPHAYWTGFYTSRPTLKYFERLGNNHLQMCKQLAVIAKLEPEKTSEIDPLREAMGVMQHHDAITGTEKQDVAYDYARILSSAIEKCDNVASAALNKIITRTDPNLSPLDFKSCLQTNISECTISENSDKFLATVYNPLSRPVDYIVRLPVTKWLYTVQKPDGTETASQLVPIPELVLNIPGRKSKATMELIFKAEAVPPLGYSVYFIETTKSPHVPEKNTVEEEVTLGSSESHVKISGTTGRVRKINLNDVESNLHQELRYYEAAAGSNNDPSDRASGAYIFRPKGKSKPIATGAPKIHLFRGPIVSQVQVTFSDWASEIISYYTGTNYLEFEWLVGPIPIEDGQGKEVISTYHTGLQNNALFYTDSNGRQTIERKRNSRPTWNLTLEEPIAGNYYPVSTDISISDENLEITVITDRAQGGSSLEDGQIELMLHRRLLHDDGFGVGEALNETAFNKGLVARGKHWLIPGMKANPDWPKKKLFLIQEKMFSPLVTLTDLTNVNFNRELYYPLNYKGLGFNLPPEVHILTLEPWRDNSFLIRVEHIFNPTQSNKSVSFYLTEALASLTVKDCRETALGADRYLDEVSRFQWKKAEDEVFKRPEPKVSKEPLLVTLTPKDIRTFICEA